MPQNSSIINGTQETETSVTPLKSSAECTKSINKVSAKVESEPKMQLESFDPEKIPGMSTEKDAKAHCIVDIPPRPLLTRSQYLDVFCNPFSKAVEGGNARSIETMKQKNKRRCWHCRKKIGLTSITCRCGYTFCNFHRYAEEHACSFDFKMYGKRKLEEENPQVQPLKVLKIN